MVVIVLALGIYLAATNIDFNKPKSSKIEVVTHQEGSVSSNVSMIEGINLPMDNLMEWNYIIIFSSLGIILLSWIYRIFHGANEY